MRNPLPRVCLSVGLLWCVLVVASASVITLPAPAAGQTPAVRQRQTARVETAAPVFLFPDAARTPLRTLEPGTILSVERTQGEWVQVIFSDPLLGQRTGWIELKYITLNAPEAIEPREPPPDPQLQMGRPAEAPAQPPARPAPRGPEPVTVRAFGTFSYDKVSATDSFDAIFGSDSLLSYGGGVQVANLWRGLFVEVSIERSQKDGERVFVFEDEVSALGIPLELVTMPVDVIGGWRFRPPGNARPFVGAGVTFLGYKETSDFAESDEEVDDHSTGFVALGGVEVATSRWFHVRGEVRYRYLPDILGLGGVSAEFDEDQLGGFGVGIKVIVGR